MNKQPELNKNIHVIAGELGMEFTGRQRPKKFMADLGKLATSQYTDNETWEKILQATQDDNEFYASELVRGILAAAAYDKDGSKALTLPMLSLAKEVVKPHSIQPDTNRYGYKQRCQKIAAVYPRVGQTKRTSYVPSFDIKNLLENSDGLSFLVAPETRSMIYKKFIVTARAYVINNGSRRMEKDKYFASIQRLASAAQYPTSGKDRREAVTSDIFALRELTRRVQGFDVSVGPVLNRLINLQLDPRNLPNLAPARMAMNECLEYAKPHGLSVNAADLRGYIYPLQTALMLDFTRAIEDISEQEKK